MKHLKKSANKIRSTYIYTGLSKLTEYTFARYMMVGVSNSTVCFSVMYLGALLKLHYLSYTALGYFVAIFFSFFMNLRFTFRVEGDVLKRLIMFFFVSITNLAIVEVIEFVMIDKGGFNRMFSILTGMSWYVAAGFLVNRYLIYKHKM